MDDKSETGGERNEELDVGTYLEYVDRRTSLRGDRKQLDEETFGRLGIEFERLMLRIDWEDIQLDEWKRLEELRFLLILSADDDEI